MPARSARVAWVCRRSCKRISGSSARFGSSRACAPVRQWRVRKSGDGGSDQDEMNPRWSRVILCRPRREIAFMTIEQIEDRGTDDGVRMLAGKMTGEAREVEKLLRRLSPHRACGSRD